MRLRPDPWLLAAVALCLSVRLAAVFFAPADTERLGRDPDMYGHLAGRIARGETYSAAGEETPTARRPPLYPLLLSPLYRLGLGGTAAPLALQAVLDALTCAALYLFAREIGATVGGARLAALAWAVYLPAAAMSTRLWSEPLGALVTTMALWAAAAAVRRGGLRWSGGAGALFGLASLARAATTPLAAPVAAAVALFSGGRPGQRLGRAGVFLLAWAAVLLPWAARNAAAVGVFTPLTTHGGFSLYDGNRALADEDYLRNAAGRGSVEAFRRALKEREGLDLDALSEAERDRRYRAEALRLIRAHPGRYALLSLLRFARLWLNVGYMTGPPSAASLGVCAVNGALLAAFAAGLVRRGRRVPRAAAPALAAIAGATLVHMGVIAFFRYAVPFVPCVLGATAALHWPEPEAPADGAPTSSSAASSRPLSR